MSATSPNNENASTVASSTGANEFSVLDAVISQGAKRDKNRRENAKPEVAGFLEGKLDSESQLALWLGNYRARVHDIGFEQWKRETIAKLSAVCRRIDDLVGGSVEAILHADKFQKLEASWRGLELLVDAAQLEQRSSRVKIRLLNVSWRDIKRDFDRASDFDQSEVFRKVYEEEFGSPGGEPYGAIVADYEIHPHPSASHPFDDVKILDQLAGVAAAAFCPMVIGASPSLFGVDEFYELQSTTDLARGFQVKELVQWRAFRKQEDARFVGIALPRIYCEVLTNITILSHFSTKKTLLQILVT